MAKVEIKVFKLKIIKSFIEGCHGVLVTALGISNFARDQQFLSVCTRVDNALADTCFVTMDGSSIYVPIPFPESFLYCSTCSCSIWDLPTAKSKTRDSGAVLAHKTIF